MKSKQLIEVFIEDINETLPSDEEKRSLDGYIDELTKKLIMYRNDGYYSLYISRETYYGSNDDIKIYGTRIETDEEFFKRIADEKRAEEKKEIIKKNAKEKRHAEYLRLKEEFES